MSIPSLRVLPTTAWRLVGFYALLTIALQHGMEAVSPWLSLVLLSPKKSRAQYGMSWEMLTIHKTSSQGRACQSFSQVIQFDLHLADRRKVGLVVVDRQLLDAVVD